MRTPNGVRFQVHQKGKHDHVAPARRKNQRNTRAQLDAVRNAPPSLTPQQILLTHKDLDLDAQRIRAIKSADMRKIRPGSGKNGTTSTSNKTQPTRSMGSPSHMVK